MATIKLTVLWQAASAAAIQTCKTFLPGIQSWATCCVKYSYQSRATNTSAVITAKLNTAKLCMQHLYAPRCRGKMQRSYGVKRMDWKYGRNFNPLSLRAMPT